MPTERPDWLTEPCPAWCSGDHDGQQYPADRQHQSPQHWHPAVMQHRDHDGHHPTRFPTATEFCVVAVRYVGERETWIAIATETQQLEFSHESARRLHAELDGLLRRMA